MKKALITALIIGIITAVSFGAVSAFAEGEGAFGGLFRVKDGTASYSADGGETWTEDLPDDIEFQTEIFDDGRIVSWSGDEKPPELPAFDGSMNPRGEFKDRREFSGEFPDDFSGRPGEFGGNFAVKHEDGVIMFSEDGGETWTEDFPHGHEFSFEEGEGGRKHFRHSFRIPDNNGGYAPEAEETSIL